MKIIITNYSKFLSILFIMLFLQLSNLTAAEDYTTVQQPKLSETVSSENLLTEQSTQAAVTTHKNEMTSEAVALFDVDLATQAYIDRLDKDTLERSNSYFEGGYWLQLWSLIFGLAVAYLLLQTGLSVKMRNISRKFTRFSFIQNVVYMMQYIVLVSIISFPFSYYQGFYREHEYALSNLSFADWLGEEFKGLLISLFILSLLIATIYKVIQRARKTWAIWGAGVSIAFLIIIVMIAPVYLAPVFNDYKPLEESSLKNEILSMARANGVPADNVYEFDASKQSKRISANVSGMFGTLRVSLNDNLLNRSDPSTIKGVMGHELGHYVLNHSVKHLTSFGIVIILAFAFLKWGFNRFNKEAWGITGEDDIAGWPLAGALFSIFFFVMTPVTNSIIRSAETEADYFGLNASQQPEGFAEGILSLSEYRKMKPGYWEEIIFYDHPSGYNRIHASMQWKKEHPGVGKHFESTDEK